MFVFFVVITYLTALSIFCHSLIHAGPNFNVVFVISLTLIVVIPLLSSIYYVLLSHTNKKFLNALSAVLEGENLELQKLKISSRSLGMIQRFSEKVLLVEKLNKNIEEYNKLHHGFFNTMINGLIVHEKMKVIEVNRALCEMTGFTGNELLQISLERLIIPHESLMGDIHSDMPRLFYRSMCFPKTGERFPVEIQMSCIKYGENDLQISIVRDLREKRDIEEQLQSERARKTKAIFDGQEMERRRLAKEIHDGLGQSLIAIRLLIEGKIAGSHEVDDEALEKIRTLIDRTIDDARLMSNNLMPSVLHEFGFVTALRQLCDHVRQSTKIKVNFNVECSRFMLSSLQTVYLFRIAQEAINNILKHSGATEMTVDISQTESLLDFSISDNGKGISNEKMTQIDGNGLYNIRERTQLLKGEFEIHSQPGQGTEIKIRIPNWRIVSHE